MRALFVGLGSIGTRHLKNLTALCAQKGIPLEAEALRSSARQLPPEQLELILEPVGTRSSPPRRPTASARRSPVFLSTAAAGPASNAYKRRPRAPPSAQATSGLPLELH